MSVYVVGLCALIYYDNDAQYKVNIINLVSSLYADHMYTLAEASSCP